MVPPFTAVALKDTSVWVQVGLLKTSMDTPAVRLGFTTIEIEFEVAGLFVAQAKFEVTWHTTISPVDSAELEYVELVPPTTLPFKVH